MPLLEQRIKSFLSLGNFLKEYKSKKYNEKQLKFYKDLELLITLCYTYNGWFTPENIDKALTGIASMLDEQALREFCKTIKEPQQVKTVAVIMAGNIPAVGFHDMLCVLLSGNKVLIKVSSDDHALIPFLAGMLIYFEPKLANLIQFSENRLSDFDAVIATGSNNTSRYFDYYFGKYPNIIRKNRNSVAILSGKESREELKQLGHDIFDYFGLGCRNVSKVFVPEKYVFDTLFECVYDFNFVINNKKYGNNYDYNRAIYLLDGVQFLDNNFLMIKEDQSFASPVSVLFFEYYHDLNDLEDKLLEQKEQIQCVASNMDLKKLKKVSLGSTQMPTLFDFADEVNTIEFLNTLNK